MNAKALSTYMGHANIGITLDRYGHLMPGNEDEAAALLDSYLERADTAARIAQVSLVRDNCATIDPDFRLFPATSSGSFRHESANL